MNPDSQVLAKVASMLAGLPEGERRVLTEFAMACSRGHALPFTARTRPVADTVAEYLAWGNYQGGRGGRPWSPKHSHNRRVYLTWWQAKLNLKVMGDLDGILAGTEQALRGLRAAGKTGKTTKNYAEALGSFLDWCVRREYIQSDPLKNLGRIDITPAVHRRALTAGEIRRLLNATDATPYGQERRLGYELALVSGLRAGELRALRVKHLDTKRGGLVLEAAWTKNRKGGFHPIPSLLLGRLARLAAGKDPEAPLVFVPRESARALRKDLKRAGIPFETAEGKVDFHALRVAYVTFLVETGADLKTVQTLARHSDPRLTQNLYAKTRDEKLAGAAAEIGKAMLTSSKRGAKSQRSTEAA